MKEIVIVGRERYFKAGWEYYRDAKYNVVVDDWRYEFLNSFSWKIHCGGDKIYAVSFNRELLSKTNKNAMLHHYIIGYPNNGLVVDHIDGNTLNNLDNNLAVVTVRQNLQNIYANTYSKLPGVTYDISKSSNNFVSRIRINGKHKFLGGFDNQVDAFFAYKKELERIGEAFTDYTLKKCYQIIDNEMVHI